MRKLLLFFAMCCASIGAWAAATVNSQTQVYNFPYTHVIEAYDLEPGDLARWLSDPTSNQYKILATNGEWDSATDVVCLKISASELSKEDLEALANVKSQISFFDLDNATLADGASISDIANSNVKYLTLPDGTESLTANSLPNCPAMEAACANTTSTKLVAYVNTPGTLYKATAMIPANSDQSKLENVTDIKVSGNVAPNDIVNTSDYTDWYSESDPKPNWNNCAFNRNWKQTKYKNADLSDAVFSDPTHLRAISYMKGLETVQLPKTGTTIPSHCFEGLATLKEIDFPDNYTTIEDQAFVGCSGLKRITIGRNIKNVGSNCFTNCLSLETIAFEKGISDMDFGEGAFYNIQSLKHVVLPEGVRNLGKAMFKQCINLESIRLPSTIENIGDECFMQCSKLTYLAIPENVKTIGKGAFGNSGIKDIYITAKDLAHLPSIWTAGHTDLPNAINGNGQLSSFGANSLLNNNSNAGVAVNGLTFDAAADEYYKVNKAAVLHFPDDFENKEEVFATDISGTYGFTSTEEDGTHLGLPDLNHTVDGQSDLLRRLLAAESNPDDPSMPYLTKTAWKQFMLMKEYKANGGEVFQKEYTDVWYTMCFPWHLDDEQLEQAYNAEYNICEFSGAEIVDQTVEGVEIHNMILHFNEIATEKTIDGKGYLALAGHPYMIHPNTGATPTNDGSGKVKCYFTGVKAISGIEPESVTKSLENGEGTMTFIGTFEDANLPQSSYFLGTKKGDTYPKFWRRGSEDTQKRWKQYTAIVKPDAQAWSYIYNNVINNSANIQGAKLAEFFIDEYEGEDAEATDIEEILNDAKEKNLPVEYMNVIYNINGQVISNDSKDLQNLPKGLYIVNGKKYFVK